jgi:hypothetical protein
MLEALIERKGKSKPKLKFFGATTADEEEETNKTRRKKESKPSTNTSTRGASERRANQQKMYKNKIKKRSKMYPKKPSPYVCVWH